MPIIYIHGQAEAFMQARDMHPDDSGTEICMTLEEFLEILNKYKEMLTNDQA
jgi:hypothetical protein